MTNNPLNHNESLDDSVPSDNSAIRAEIQEAQAVLDRITETSSISGSEAVQLLKTALNVESLAKVDMFKVRLGDLNELIDHADLEAEGHGMSQDLSKLVDEMSEIISELKAIIAS